MVLKKGSTSSQKAVSSDPVYLKFLVYSPPGHGKTCLIGTAMEDPQKRFWPGLILDFESGVGSIKSKVRTIRLGDLGEIPPQEGFLDRIKIKTWADFQVVYDFLFDHPHVYQFVALDSLSEMNYLNMATIMEHEVATDSKHDPDIAEQRDYLRSANQMKKLVRGFRDLEMHTIICCLAMEAQDARTKKYQMRPALTGKMALEVPGLFETFGYLAIVEPDGDDPEYRYLFTTPTERFMAKDRSEGGLLSPGVPHPTLPLILDLLEGKAILKDGEVIGVDEIPQ